MIQEVATTSPSHDLSHVLVALSNKWAICLPIKLATGMQIVKTTALIDCGATGNFIDIGLLSQANFPLQHLPKPIKAYNVDGTAMSREPLDKKSTWISSSLTPKKILT